MHSKKSNKKRKRARRNGFIYMRRGRGGLHFAMPFHENTKLSKVTVSLQCNIRIKNAAPPTPPFPFFLPEPSSVDAGCKTEKNNGKWLRAKARTMIPSLRSKRRQERREQQQTKSAKSTASPS